MIGNYVYMNQLSMTIVTNVSHRFFVQSKPHPLESSQFIEYVIRIIMKFHSKHSRHYSLAEEGFFFKYLRPVTLGFPNEWIIGATSYPPFKMYQWLTCRTYYNNTIQPPSSTNFHPPAGGDSSGERCFLLLALSLAHVHVDDPSWIFHWVIRV